MTTYTINEQEYDQLIKLGNKIICAGNGNLPGNSLGNDLGRGVIGILRNLQPNTQEPRKDITFGGPKAREHLLNQLVHPAPQKPLTHEQINDLMQEADAKWSDADVPMHWARHFARAIEQAHGVKP